MTVYYNPSYERFICGGLLDHGVEALILETLGIRVEDQGRLLWENKSSVFKDELELFGHILGVEFVKRVYSI